MVDLLTDLRAARVGIYPRNYRNYSVEPVHPSIAPILIVSRSAISNPELNHFSTRRCDAITTFINSFPCCDSENVNLR